MTGWEMDMLARRQRARMVARMIAYHDQVTCRDPGCGCDISTYPIPPDDWEPDADTDTHPPH